MLTAVNIKGVFNISNETKYEKQAPDGMSEIQFNLLTFVLSAFKYHILSGFFGFQVFLLTSIFTRPFGVYRLVNRAVLVCVVGHNSKYLLLAALRIVILGGTAMGKMPACLLIGFSEIYEKFILMAILLTSSCLQK